MMAALKRDNRKDRRIGIYDNRFIILQIGPSQPDAEGEREIVHEASESFGPVHLDIPDPPDCDVINRFLERQIFFIAVFFRIAYHSADKESVGSKILCRVKGQCRGRIVLRIEKLAQKQNILWGF